MISKIIQFGMLILLIVTLLLGGTQMIIVSTRIKQDLHGDMMLGIIAGSTIIFITLLLTFIIVWKASKMNDEKRNQIPSRQDFRAKYDWSFLKRDDI